MTPSLPTFRNASASTSPIVGSLLPAIVAICCRSLSCSSRRSASAMLVDRFDRPPRRPCAMPRAEGHRIGAGGDHLQAFAEDRLGQHGGGRRAVAGDVVRLAGGFLDELGAQVLVRVVELDVLGDGDAVLGDLGRAPALVEHGVAAAGAERAADGPGQLRSRRPASGCRASSSKTICFATRISSCCGRARLGAGQLLTELLAGNAAGRCRIGARRHVVFHWTVVCGTEVCGTVVWESRARRGWLAVG